jgi:tetratricopeptide (TPR) repeat protein
MPITVSTFGCIGLMLTVSMKMYPQTKSAPTNDRLPISTTGDIFTPTRPANGIPDSTLPNMVGVSGKVALDDGTSLKDRALIQSDCHGVITAEGYTDTKGAFSIQFTNKEPNQASTASETPTTRVDPSTIRYDTPRNWRDCDLRAVLPGFVSQVVALGSRTPSFGNTDIGTIQLHRLSAAEDLTVSATSARAPGDARKDYEKGLEDTKNGKLDSAQEKFQKAVQAFPQYAAAWLELGRVQAQKNDTAGARQSFHQAIAADGRFISPYRELASLAGHDKQWQELADTSDQLIKLNALDFPEFWFSNAVAKFHLQNYDAAENSARQGIKIDPQHRIPKLEYVLGIIEAQKGDYQGAGEHLRKYLSLSPSAAEAADTRKKIEDVERLSAAAPAPKP